MANFKKVTLNNKDNSVTYWPQTSLDNIVDAEGKAAIVVTDGALDEAIEGAGQVASGYATAAQTNAKSYADSTFATSATVAELGNKVNALTAGTISVSIVDALPTIENAQYNIIYMIPSEASDDANVRDEYMLIGQGDAKHFEIIGTTAVDVENKADLSGAAFTGSITVPDITDATATSATVVNKGYIDDRFATVVYFTEITE